MSQYFVSGSELNQVASAIRKKGQTSNNLTWPDGMISAIRAIPQQVDGISPYDMETLDVEITDLTDFPIVSEQDTYYSDINIDIDSTEKAKIISANIKSGVSILGVNGSPAVVDTSDATATASNISYGATAYINGQKITGTLVPLTTNLKTMVIIGEEDFNREPIYIIIQWIEGNTLADITVTNIIYQGAFSYFDEYTFTSFIYDNTNHSYILTQTDENSYGNFSITIPCSYDSSTNTISKKFDDNNIPTSGIVSNIKAQLITT